MYKNDNSCFHTSSVTFLYGFNFNLFNTIPFRIFHDAGTSYKLLEPQQLGGLRAGRTDLAINRSGTMFEAKSSQP